MIQVIVKTKQYIVFKNIKEYIYIKKKSCYTLQDIQKHLFNAILFRITIFISNKIIYEWYINMSTVILVIVKVGVL